MRGLFRMETAFSRRNVFNESNARFTHAAVAARRAQAPESA
jgi:hypothetical protein